MMGGPKSFWTESRAFPVAAFTVEEIQKKTICVNDCLVLLLTQQTAPHSLLQFGKLKSRLRVGDKRVSRYLLLSGRVNAQNIRIINLLALERADTGPAVLGYAYQLPLPGNAEQSD